MTNINDLYPSNYLKSGDLQGRDITAKMARVEIVKVGDDTKPALYFHGAEKGLLLNKTNSMLIASIYGPETDQWIGQPITLYSAWVDFRGQQVQAIRVKMAPEMVASLQNGGHRDPQAPIDRPIGGMGAQALPASEPAGAFNQDLDDEIPF